MVISCDPLYFCGVYCNFCFNFHFIYLSPLFSFLMNLVSQFCSSFQRTDSFLFFCSYFMYFHFWSLLLLPLLTLVFSFFFSSSFRYKVRLFEFFCFLRYTYITANFPLRTIFAADRFLSQSAFFFFLISSLISSVIHWLFSSMLFGLHIFVFSSVFLLVVI